VLQILKTVDNFEHIIEVAKEQSRKITLIGYLDQPYKNRDIGDLLLYVGLPDNICGWGKYMLRALKLKLMGSSLIVKINNNKLIMFDETIADYTHTLEFGCGSGLLLVKLTDGLNNFGITGTEVRAWLLQASSEYFELISKGGDD